MQGNGILGNLTEAPTVNSTKGGKKVARFTVAVNDGYRDKTGEWHERPPLYFRIESWSDAAAAQSWPQGALVALVGHWRATTYEVDGEKRRQQYFAADAAALVPRQRAQADTPAADQIDPDDPYAGAE